MDASAYNAKIYDHSEKLNGMYYKVFRGRTRKVIELLNGFEGKLLDVGCGDATMTAEIKDALKCEVKAVELIEGNVAKAKEKGIETKKVDLNKEKLPFAANSFDGVFAGEVLEHVVDSEGLLLEMKRVLRKEGILLLTVPNIANWYNRIIMLFGYLPHYVESGSIKSYGTPFGVINGHVKAFTKRSIVEMVEGNGFRIETIKGSGYSRVKTHEYEKGFIKLLSPFFFKLENFLSKRSSLATNLLVKAVKK